MFKFFHKFKNPYPPISNPSPDYLKKERIWNNTMQLWPLINHSKASAKMKRIIMELNQTSYDSLMLMKPEIKNLPKIIHDHESIVIADSGDLNGMTVLMILTNVRLIFVNFDLIKRTCKQTSIPIRQLMFTRNYHWATKVNLMKIGSGANEIDVRGVRNGNQFAKAINHLLAIRRDNS